MKECGPLRLVFMLMGSKSLMTQNEMEGVIVLISNIIVYKSCWCLFWSWSLRPRSISYKATCVNIQR